MNWQSLTFAGAGRCSGRVLLTARHDDGSTKQYAVKFISDPGKQNGLYWESPEGQPKSPLGPLVAFASTEGYSAAQANSHVPFHGYYFRMLNRQGSHAQGGAKDYMVDGKMVNGFAFIAYPAEYGNSGIMTFIINQDGVLLQKDLGKTTAETAAAISEFNPIAVGHRLKSERFPAARNLVARNERANARPRCWIYTRLALIAGAVCLASTLN